MSGALSFPLPDPRALLVSAGVLLLSTAACAHGDPPEAPTPEARTPDARTPEARTPAAAAAEASSTSAAPTLVLHGGRVYTGDPDRPSGPWAEAVAVTGERISAVGGSAEVLALAGSATEVVDLEGRLVIPGLNDAHVHVIVPRPSVDLGLGRDPPLDEVLDSVAAAAGRTPAGTWLTGTIAAGVFDDARTDRMILDRAAPDHPVYLSGWTGHGRFLSTAAMRALGVDEREPDGFGGWFERREGTGADETGADETGADETGVLTGVAHGYAAFRLDVARSRPADSLAVVAFRDLAAEAASFGITSVQQMAMPFLAESSLEVLARTGLPVRWRVIRMPVERSDLDDPRFGGGEEASGIEGVRAGGVKWVADGTPVERMMVLGESYADRPGWEGRFYLEPEVLERAVRGAWAAGEQLMVHATGDGAIRALFDAMEAVDAPAAWVPRRTRIEHGDLLLPDLFDRARDLGVVVVQNPSHLTIPPIMDRRFEGVRRERLQPLRSLLEDGIPLAFGSDGPLNPFLNIMFAVVHPVSPDEALTMQQAIAAYTRGSAFAEFTEDEKGILRPGMLADLAVLSQDVFRVPSEALPATTSLLTVVGGEVVHRSEDFPAGR